MIDTLRVQHVLLRAIVSFASNKESRDTDARALAVHFLLEGQGKSFYATDAIDSFIHYCAVRGGAGARLCVSVYSTLNALTSIAAMDTFFADLKRSLEENAISPVPDKLHNTSQIGRLARGYCLSHSNSDFPLRNLTFKEFRHAMRKAAPHVKSLEPYTHTHTHTHTHTDTHTPTHGQAKENETAGDIQKDIYTHTHTHTYTRR
eukprot:GHVR01129421.1.p1 GENE.GHVR01129421.1~~GHVR01129421.1.p1  ORF type:complete len:204 (+),score=83.26 GHVR01129421.1:64-675(+)